MANRPMHFIWLVDCSGSMAYEGKIQALNHAVRSVPQMVDAARRNRKRGIGAGDRPSLKARRWVIDATRALDRSPGPTSRLAARRTGPRARMVAGELMLPPMSERALPPVLVLISDGQPTDDFGNGLAALLDEPWGE